MIEDVAGHPEGCGIVVVVLVVVVDSVVVAARDVVVVGFTVVIVTGAVVVVVVVVDVVLLVAVLVVVAAVVIVLVPVVVVALVVVVGWCERSRTVVEVLAGTVDVLDVLVAWVFAVVEVLLAAGVDELQAPSTTARPPTNATRSATRGIFGSTYGRADRFISRNRHANITSPGVFA